jgi:hypothetical protein
MARFPRNAAEAVDALGLAENATVALVGPDHGFIGAVASAIGDGGKLVVASPPPDEETESAEVVDAIATDTKADAVVAWLSVVTVHNARELAGNVADGGSLWLVMPKGDRETRAPVTEGEIKRTMLSAGWREDRVVQFSKDAAAVRFRRRR